MTYTTKTDMNDAIKIVVVGAGAAQTLMNIYRVAPGKRVLITM